MKTVEDYAQIRDAYFNQHKSIREIARELKHGRDTIAKALDMAEPGPYQRVVQRADPVLGPYKAKIDELLAENERLPRKQRYTAQKIYAMVHDCLLYTSPSPRDRTRSRMPSSA